MPEGSVSRDDPAWAMPRGLSGRTLGNFPVSIVLADPRQEDCPLIYVNRAFCETTGYDAADAVGHNCRFLQGERTAPADRERIRAALEAETPITVDIVNYRADGSPFSNHLMIVPLYDDDNALEYFLGVQSVSDGSQAWIDMAEDLEQRLRELQHRVKNHLSMVLAMIRLESRKRPPKEAIDMLARRVEALSLLYEEFSTAETGTEELVELAAYLRRVADALHTTDGRSNVALELDLAEGKVAMDDAARLGLILSEVVTNALRHAFPDDATGRITVRLKSADDDTATLEVEDDGRGLEEGETWPKPGSLGSRIVSDLVDKLDARMAVDTGNWGTRVAVTFQKARTVHDRRGDAEPE